MSKKRTSLESSTEEESKEGSELFQPGDNAKRAKLASVSYTTFEDLPPELMEQILIKAVVTEVMDMKLAKCAWKQKADRVISRLSDVCSQWSDILTTNYFRKELNRILDSTAQETIRLEILYQSSFKHRIYRMATMKDEIFLLCPTQKDDDCINVYDRYHMEAVKDVIPLPGVRTQCLVACPVSNCLYVLNRKNKNNHFSVLCIARDDEGRFTASRPIIRDMYLPDAGMCVSANGSLIISRQQSIQIDAITVCDGNGNLLHTIRLPSDLPRLSSIVPKSNGNLVLVHRSVYPETKLMEIDMAGVIVRQYQSSLYGFPYVRSADHHGRMLISVHTNGMELLDAEFNQLEFSGLQLGVGQFDPPHVWRYNRDRNELVAMASDSAGYSENRLLTICQLI